MSPRRSAGGRRDSVLGKDKYPPLSDLTEQIRICRIEPDSEDSELVLTLRTANFTEVAGQYVGISYAWGDSNDLASITLNGHKHPVTRNLHYLLRRLRAFDLGDSLWIDTVSINQDLTHEKNEQVKQMPRIYSGAREVLIVLEEAVTQDIDSHVIIKTILDELAQGKHQGKHLDELDCFIPSHANAPPTPAAQRFLRLLTSKWFTRIWTRQEICLSKKPSVLCSSGRIPWNVLVDAFEGWNRHRIRCCKDVAKTLNQETMTACYAVYDHIKSIKHTTENLQDQHILELILLFQHLEASDKRDKYCALHGLSTNPERLPAPNYNVKPEMVFLELIKWILNDTRSLKVLALELRGELELPSWMPDLAAISDLNPNHLRSRFRFLDHYDCTRGSASLECSFGYPATNVLALKGIIIDRVQATVRPMQCFPGTSEYAKTLAEWYSFVTFEDTSLDSISFDHRVDCFAMTMIAGCAAEDESNIRRATKSDLERWRDVLYQLLYGSFVESDETSGLILCHVTAVLNRRLFRTVEGRLGVGPHRLRSGDPIWAFKHGPAPCVLRRSQKGQYARSEYTLIGHCYLDGAMRGEAIPKPSESWPCHLV